MKIGSVRLGHANNSSSTHSILINSRYKAKPSESGDFQYGWDWFHLKEKDDKSKYLATLVYDALREGMAEEHASVIARELTGYSPHAQAPDHYAYVDHQSVICFPKRYGQEHIHPDFLREFVEYVRDNPRVTIRGGNDNSDDPGDSGFGTGPREWSPKGSGDPGERSSLNAIPRDSRNVPLFGRKDQGWWILYNRDGGAKIRVSFSDKAEAYLHSTTPELVDVKITDFCPHGCEFCYQSSTTKGKHADSKHVESILWQLHSGQVFEVAFGGGETTMHPDFRKFLEIASGQGITPNFTTFNMAWTKDEAMVEAVKKYAGSFAVSNLDAVPAMSKWNAMVAKEKGWHGNPQATLQIPLGCYPEEKVREAIKAAKEAYVNVTFLGYKHFGRGEGFAQYPSAWILDMVTGPNGLPRFGADSVFIEQYGDELKAKGVSEKLMVNREGAFSCYVDAVTMQMGASSYTKELHPVEDRNMWKNFPYAKVG